MDDSRDMTEVKKNIIIASPNVDFANSLKRFFEANGLNVVETVVILEDLIEFVEKLNHQKIPIDGILLTSDIAKKGGDKRLEYLSDYLLNIRTRFSHINITFLSNEPEGHPLLAELVSMGVYNIILKKEGVEGSIDAYGIISGFYKPAPFSSVAHFRNIDPSIPWRKIQQGGAPLTINVKVVNEPNKNETPKQTKDDWPEKDFPLFPESSVETAEINEMRTESQVTANEEFRMDDINISPKEQTCLNEGVSSLLPSIYDNTRLISIISPTSSGKTFLLGHLLNYLPVDTTVLDRSRELNNFPIKQKCYSHRPERFGEITVIESRGEREIIERSEVIIFVHTPHSYHREKYISLMNEILKSGIFVLPIMNMWSEDLPISAHDLVGKNVMAIVPYFPEWIAKTWAGKLLHITQLEQLASYLGKPIQR
ncbi:hypothetical protein ABEV55_16175 [Aneurinibacillus thermoaerophilus]|uniref:hypothetical protein n=1 Tax=Aneurinibacillus thermoaerophilus TaxID=143495 RepID=UPI002E1D94E6|nr:hypothetical protein [Aneurinibacillus thermoaerophilus]